MAETKAVVGWREWLNLPELSLGPLKAKVDTGAKTCALHAFYVEPFTRNGLPWVRFGVHPIQRRPEPEIHCAAPVVDRRTVTDSGGHRELRYVIETVLQLADYRLKAQITLTDRENMRFRMLLGRNALRGNFLIDPSRSYALGKPNPLSLVSD